VPSLVGRAPGAIWLEHGTTQASAVGSTWGEVEEPGRSCSCGARDRGAGSTPDQSVSGDDSPGYLAIGYGELLGSFLAIDRLGCDPCVRAARLNGPDTTV
jgi:hypothetical protein